MRQQYKHLVFISAQVSFRHSDFEHNSLKSYLLRQGFKPIEVNGRYYDENEKSFMVQIEDESKLELFTKIGRSFNQHSIMYRDNENNCELIFCKDETRERLGKLIQVSNPVGLSNSTELNGKFYTTRG